MSYLRYESQHDRPHRDGEGVAMILREPCQKHKMRRMLMFAPYLTPLVDDYNAVHTQNKTSLDVWTTWMSGQQARGGLDQTHLKHENMQGICGSRWGREEPSNNSVCVVTLNRPFYSI